jgi:outer membrane protein OmpA-like peptidoglycan-associated protein
MAHFLNSLRGRMSELSHELGHEPLTPNSKRILLIAFVCAAILPLIVHGALNRREAASRAATSTSAHSTSNSDHAPVDGTTADKDLESSDAGDSATVALPGGEHLQALPQGMEYRLVKYVDRTAPTQSNGTWFDLDRLSYQTGKALPDEVAQDQVQNLAKIMNAFPDVDVLIGGFADGNTKAARKLSDARAKNIKAELVQLGVEQSRITARGFGNDRPVNNSASSTGQADISLLVTKR